MKNFRINLLSCTLLNVLTAPDILAVEEAEKLEVLQALANKVPADDPSVVYTPYLIEGNDIGGIDTGFLVRSTVQVDAITIAGSPSELWPPNHKYQTYNTARAIIACVGRAGTEMAIRWRAVCIFISFGQVTLIKYGA